MERWFCPHKQLDTPWIYPELRWTGQQMALYDRSTSYLLLLRPVHTCTCFYYWGLYPVWKIGHRSRRNWFVRWQDTIRSTKQTLGSSRCVGGFLLFPTYTCYQQTNKTENWTKNMLNFEKYKKPAFCLFCSILDQVSNICALSVQVGSSDQKNKHLQIHTCIHMHVFTFSCRIVMHCQKRNFPISPNPAQKRTPVNRKQNVSLENTDALKLAFLCIEKQKDSHGQWVLVSRW